MQRPAMHDRVVPGMDGTVKSRHPEGPADLYPRPHYLPHDVLTDDDVRFALGPLSDSKWEDVLARIPWSLALGQRTRRIVWGRLLEWLGEHERGVA